MPSSLPNAAECIVSEAKLRDYLLDRNHPDGGPKAKFLESFGFSLAESEVLREALKVHAEAPVAEHRETDFGTIHEIVARLASPDGRNPVVRSVWMTDTGTTRPRLITLVPAEERP